MEKKLPVYKFKLKFKKGADTMSIVGSPAFQSDFFMFSEEEKYHFYDEPKRMIAGLALIPDKKVYRRVQNSDGTQEEFYGMFDAQEIETVRNDFMAGNNNTKVNFEHDGRKSTDKIHLVESYIVESKLQQEDLKQRFGISAPMKSWFVQYFAEDIETFNEIKRNGFHGFSLEVYLDKEPVNNNKFKNQTKMNKLVEKFKSLLSDMVDSFEDTIAVTGEKINVGEVGEPVTITKVDINGEPVDSPCPDGEYLLETGETVVCEGGMLKERMPAPDAPVELVDDEEEVQPEVSTEAPVASTEAPVADVGAVVLAPVEEVVKEPVAVVEAPKAEDTSVSGETKTQKEDKTPLEFAELKQKFAHQQEVIDALSQEITALKAQLRLPMTKPVQNSKEKQLFQADLAKMTPYERAATAKGLRVIN